jgi:hypothetical protein
MLASTMLYDALQCSATLMHKFTSALPAVLLARVCTRLVSVHYLL